MPDRALCPAGVTADIEDLPLFRDAVEQFHGGAHLSVIKIDKGVVQDEEGMLPREERVGDGEAQTERRKALRLSKNPGELERAAALSTGQCPAPLAAAFP